MADHRDPTPSFASSEGLRHLLHRINAEGRHAWERDPEVRALFEFTIAKYRPICRKWRRDPIEAAAVVFVVLQSSYALRADDPWAVATKAVQLRIPELALGDKLLIAPDKVGKVGTADWEAPVRAGDYEEFLFGAAPDPRDDEAPAPTLDRVRGVIVELFTLLGWDEAAITTAIDFVLNHLTATANATTAHDYLRRDDAIPALLGISRASWTALLRILFDERDGGTGLSAVGLIRRIAFAAPTVTRAAQVAELLNDADLFGAVLDAGAQR